MVMLQQRAAHTRVMKRVVLGGMEQPLEFLSSTMRFQDLIALLRGFHGGTSMRALDAAHGGGALLPWRAGPRVDETITGQNRTQNRSKTNKTPLTGQSAAFFGAMASD